jgi:hypothetical protein
VLDLVTKAPPFVMTLDTSPRTANRLLDAITPRADVLYHAYNVAHIVAERGQRSASGAGATSSVRRQDTRACLASPLSALDGCSLLPKYRSDRRRNHGSRQAILHRSDSRELMHLGSINHLRFVRHYYAFAAGPSLHRCMARPFDCSPAI